MISAAPKNVSPFIRAGRWSLLLAGLVYGRVHYNTLNKREDHVRQDEIDRVTQDAIDQLSEKKIKADQSMVDLAQAAGIDPTKARMKRIDAERHSLKTAAQKADTDIFPTGPVDQSLQTNKQSNARSKHH